ncbi:MAG TPA: SMP-30/gluconolactonase/LRE family protein, partial [Opitutaceae bacterium]|nr:SMP-30/gluconolactonase/LRE family protein [Opitutaceae bacterium]
MSRLSLHRASMLAFLVVGLGPSIRAQSYAFTTVAGTSSIGDADGTGSAARFALPEGLVVDTAGNVYVADYFNSVIRKITPDGTVTTFAGQPGNFGYADGPAASARFGGLLNLAIDRSGNLYTADSYYNTVRKIAPDGRVTTIAGSPGKSGSADGTGAAALFNTPQCVAVDTVGNLYVTDTGNHTIRRIAVGGVVTTFAGDGTAGSADGSGTAAQFRSPYGIAVDPSGNIIVSDWDDCTIRKITFDGTVTTLAGLAGASGTADGTGSAARFETPAGLSVDAGGYICVAERDADDIRAISPTGVVTRLAGASNVRGYIDGTITTAQFARPTGLAVSPDNKFIYVADTDNCTVRKIDTSGNVTTFAGQPGCGWADGNGRDTRFFSPSGLALDANGNLIVADTYNHIIRQITPAGIVTTIAGGPGSPGSIDGAGPSARFRYPYG